MSSNNVDNKVVNMQFNNAQFEAGVKQTLASLDELKQSLKFNNSVTGINALSSAFNSFSLANISDQIDALQNRFSTLGIVGMTAIQNITNKVMNLASSKISGVLGQIQSGGWGRAASIAQARFTLQGLLKDSTKVEEAFKSASDAVDGTAYSLDSAVSVASQLAASGIDTGEDMKNTLLAIGGTAAMTGADFGEIGRIFTTVAGQGRLMTMQLRQLELRGINAAAEIAKSMGKTEAEIRDMTTKGEISFEEFSAAMQETFAEHAKEANKTFSGSMSNIRSALSRIGAIFASGIIENDDLINTLNDVRKTINKIKEAMLPLEDKFKNLVSAVSKMVSTLLGDFKTDSLELFVDIVGKGMETVTGLINKWTSLQTTVKESIFGKAAEETKEAADAIYASAEQIEKAREVWFQGLHGVGQARKDEFGEEYDVIQYLINQLAAGNRDLENVAVNSVLETKKAEDQLTQSVNETTESTDDLKTSLFPIGKLILSFKSYLKGIKTIVNNVKTVVLKAFSSFRKVFSIQDLISDIKDYGEIFSEFVGYFELNENRANKLETALTGLWSALDLVRMAIKAVVGGLSKTFGPVLSVILDIILTLTAKIGAIITKFRNWYRENNLLRSAMEAFGKIIKMVVTYVTTFFEKLNQLPAVKKIKDALKDLADLIGDRLLGYFSEATNTVDTFLGELDDADENPMMLRTLEAINTGLENFMGFLSEAKGNYEQFVGWVTEKGSSLLGASAGAMTLGDRIKYIAAAGKSLVNGEGLSAFLTNLSGAFGELTSGVDKFFDWAIKKFNSIDAIKVGVMGLGTALTSIGLSFSYLSWNLGALLKSLASVPLAISSTISSMKGVFKSISTYIRNDSQAKLVKSYAIAIAILAASLIALTFVDSTKLDAATKSLGSLMAIMAVTVGMVALVANSKKSDIAKTNSIMKSMALTFVTVAASAYILSLALMKLTEINWNGDVWKPISMMAGMLVALVVVTYAISKIKGKVEANAFAMLAIAGSVWLLAAALSKLNSVDINGLEERVQALAEVLMTMALFFVIIKRLAVGSGTVSVLSVIGLISAIWLIELALDDIIAYGVSINDIKQNLDKFYPVLISLGIIVAAISVLGFACKGATPMAGTILAFTFSVLLLIYAIHALAKIANNGELAVGIIALTAIFVEMFALMFVLDKVSTVAVGIGKEMIGIAIAIGILSIIAYALGHVDIVKFYEGCALLTVVILLVGLLAVVTQSAKAIDYKSLYAMIVAVGVLTVAIVAMSFIKDKLSLWQSVGILGTALLALGATLYLAGQYADKVSIKSIVAMVLMIGLIAGSILLIATKGGDWSTILAAAGGLSLVMFVLGQAIKTIGKTLDSTTLDKKHLVVLMEFVAMMAVIAASLYALVSVTNTAGIDVLYASMGALVAVLLLTAFAMAKLVKSIESSPISGKALGMLGILTTMILVIAISFSIILNAMDNVTEIKAGIGIVGMLTAMIIICYGVSELAKTLSGISLGGTVLGMMGIMVAIIISVGISMKLILEATKDVTPSKMIISIAGMILVLAAVAGVMTYLSNNFSLFNPALLGQAIVTIGLLFAVVIAMNMLLNGNNADWSKLLASAVSMSIVLSVLVAAVSVLTVIASSTGVIPALVVLGGLAVVLLSLSVAFRAFARVAKASVEALKLLSEIDMSGIDTVKLLQLVGILNLAIISCYLAGPAFISLSLGIVSLGLAVSVLATGLLVLSIPLIATAKAFQSLISVISDTNGNIASKIAAIGAAFAESITSFVTTLAIKAPVIKASLILLMATTASVITEGLNNVTEIVLNGIVNFLTKLDNKLPEITEKVNSIITTILKSIADNAETFGYYGVYISTMFLYGVAEGFNEVAPYLGELLADIITGLLKVIDSALDSLLPGIGDKLYDFYLEQAELLYGLLAEWSSGVGALTGGAASFNSFWESGYQDIVKERATSAEEKSQDVGKAIDEGTAKGIEDNSDKVDKAAEKAVSNATNQSKAASEGAKTTGDSYGTGLTDTISGYKDKIKEKITNVVNNEGLNMNLGTAGIDGASTYLNNFESGVREEKIDLTGMDDSIKQHYLDAGYEYSEDGKYLVKQIKEGAAQEAASFGDIWQDNADESLMNAMDDTNENMAEKATEGKDYYIEGLVDISDEDLQKVREAYARIGHEAHEAVVSPEGMDENSPSKKAKKAAFYYVEGLIIEAQDRQGALVDAYSKMAGAACSEVASTMASISSIVQDDSINWTPTLTPVVDASQLQNGSQMLENAFGDSALNMAASTSLSVNSSSQATLAAQVQSLSEQVKKLADTDYSKILEGVNVNVDASTNVDGTPLRRMASKFTIQQINDQTKTYNMALGGRA